MGTDPTVAEASTWRAERPLPSSLLAEASETVVAYHICSRPGCTSPGLSSLLRQAATVAPRLGKLGRAQSSHDDAETILAVCFDVVYHCGRGSACIFSRGPRSELAGKFSARRPVSHSTGPPVGWKQHRAE